MGESWRETDDSTDGNYHGKQYEPDKLLPTSILTFAKPTKRIHATEKPVPLLEYLIRTYTKDGDTVLDNCAGSGSTIIAAINTQRRWIGIEKDGEMYANAKQRIDQHQSNNVA